MSQCACKGQQTYWFQAFKEMSLQLLTAHYENQVETSVSIQEKDYRLDRINSGNTKKQIAAATTTSPWGMEGNLISKFVTLYNLKLPISNQNL